MLLDTRNACCLAGVLGILSLVVVVMMNSTTCSWVAGLIAIMSEVSAWIGGYRKRCGGREVSIVMILRGAVRRGILRDQTHTERI